MKIDNDFKTGDIVKVFQKIKEAKRDRIINFEGIVVKMRGKGENKMITVRQVIESVGVDRIIPLSMPSIVKIERVSAARKVRGNLPRKASLEKLLSHKMFSA